MNILVVDDEIDQLESLRRGLKSRGHRVFEALSAQQALNLLQDGSLGIELMITDYAMPVMDGLELLASVRQFHGNLPVILMTAFSRKDVLVKAIHWRCNGFIEKPFILSNLLKEIESATANLPARKNPEDLPQMFAKLVHRINDPLSAICVSAGMIMSSPHDPENIKKSLNKIVTAAEQIWGINNEILNLAFRESPEPELLDLVGVIDKCLEKFTEVMTFRGILLERLWPGTPVYTKGFRFDLEQLFNNLILNAIEAMENRRENASLKMTVSMQKDSIHIAVQDTGCGIPEDQLESIFTPYVTGRKKGVGLGLALAKKAIEKHGGTIRVESVLGEGTRFSIVLPHNPDDRVEVN